LNQAAYKTVRASRTRINAEIHVATIIIHADATDSCNRFLENSAERMLSSVEEESKVKHMRHEQETMQGTQSRQKSKQFNNLLPLPNVRE